MEPEKKRLVGIALRVHNALRMLKLGESATIACDKDYPVDEVRNYVWAYAMHKGKWFDCKYDPTGKTLSALRVEPGPWNHKDEDDEPDEP